MQKRWSPIELNLLRENFNLPLKSLLEIFPNRTFYAIKSARDSLRQKSSILHEPWKDNELNELKKIWAECPMDQILNRFPNRSYAALKTKARILGVYKPKFIRKGNMEPLIQDTPLAAYWMGFFMADGSLSNTGNLRCWTSIKDEEHTAAFAAFLSTNVHYDPKRNAVGLNLSDSKIGKELSERHNISTQKSVIPANLSYWNTSERFTPFFAGYVDGDGSITKKYNTIQISVHKSWLNNLYLLDQWSKKYWDIYSSTVTPENSRGYSHLRIHVRGSVRLLIEELNLPILHRKWDRIKIFDE